MGIAKEYLREGQHHARLQQQLGVTADFSPTLAGELYMETSLGRALMREVWYFRDASPEFIIRIARAMVPAQYAPREEIQAQIESLDEQRDMPEKPKLGIVERGSVARFGRVLVQVVTHICFPFLLPHRLRGCPCVSSASAAAPPPPRCSTSQLYHLERSKSDSWY